MEGLYAPSILRTTFRPISGSRLTFFYYFAIPGGIISISNIILIFQVIKAKIKRESWLIDTVNDKNQTGITTAMLIVVCLVYIALLPPYLCHRVCVSFGAKYRNTRGGKDEDVRVYQHCGILCQSHNQLLHLHHQREGILE